MIFVGQASLQGDLARYAQHFNLVELGVEAGRLPKAAGLRKWRAEVADTFAFSLRVPPKIWSADQALTEELLDYVSKVAEVLRPRVCLLQTPASATPTTRNRERLAALCDKLKSSERHLAWEPRGVWEADELSRLADELGVLLVRDLSREDYAPSGNVVYTRLLALGDATHVKSGAAHEVAERVADYDEAYVVLEGSGARGAAKIIRELLES